jgi:copper chaperone CopZ
MAQTRKFTIRLPIKIATFAAAVIACNCCLAAQVARHIEVQIIAEEMCCKGCAQKVAAQLYAAPGVTAVAADVPKRIVKITAKPSSKLTLERLWRAVEKGKGGPTKLITSQATYTLTSVDQLPPAERLAPDLYVIKVQESPNTGDMQGIIALFQSTPGVQQVDLDARQHTLTIQSAVDQPISEWALVRVANQAGHTPVRVSGPFGRLTIEYANQSRRHAAAHPSKHSSQGSVR